MLKFWKKTPSLADRLVSYTYPTINVVVESDTEDMTVIATYPVIYRRNIRQLVSR